MQSVLYLLFWALLFFFMMRFGCGAHTMGHGHHGSHHDHEDDGHHAPSEARDPVCGMTVATAGAKSSIFQSRPYYFCSSRCRETFEDAPENFTRPSTITETGREQHGTA